MDTTLIETIETSNHLFIISLAHLCNFPMESCNRVRSAGIDQGKVTFVLWNGTEQSYSFPTSQIEINQPKLATAH